VTHIIKPLLSVLIPVYNHERYVEECIRSIWDQHFPQIEIIAIDDGSTDNSYSILERLKLESPIPMYIERQCNQGVVKTANKALKLSQGDYILCMASDDKLLEGALIPALNTINLNNIKFAIFNAMYFGDINKPVLNDVLRFFVSTNDVNILERLYLFPPRPLLLQSTIISREFFYSIGGWNEKVTLDDWPVFIRFFESVCSNKILWSCSQNIFLTGYRIHECNVHKDVVRQIVLTEEVINHYCPEHLKYLALTNTYVTYSLSLLRRRNLFGLKMLFKAVKISGVILVVKSIFDQVWDYFKKQSNNC